MKVKGKRLAGMPQVYPKERYEQEKVVAWARLMACSEPRLARLFHVPNGGWRHPATALAMKRLGVVRGVPDLLLPVPVGGKVGLAIEMKAQDGRLTLEQRDWLAYLDSVGWATAVCRSCEEAKGVICHYLGLDKGE